MNDKIELDIIKQHLEDANFATNLDYKKLLCVYDYKKHHEMVSI
jgi:hypothetical protein